MGCGVSVRTEVDAGEDDGGPERQGLGVAFCLAVVVALPDIRTRRHETRLVSPYTDSKATDVLP